MTETQQQNEQPLETETLQYIGKTLKGDGTKKDGSTWKSWKLQFKTNMQYPWVVSAFDTLSNKGIQVKDLEEGNYYTVWYKMNEFVGTHGPTKSKQATLIKASTADQATTEHIGQKSSKPVPVQNATAGTSGKLASRDWVNFSKEYDEATKDQTVRDPIHMLGAWILNQYSVEAEDLITLVKKHFQ